MRICRVAALLILVSVLAACGRQLPDEYFDTDTDVIVAEAVTEEDTETGSEEAVEDSTDADELTDAEDDAQSAETESETEEVADSEEPTEETDDAEADDDSETEEVVETESEPQMELVEVPADPIIEQVANADATNGETLLMAGVPCTSCHSFDSENSLVGPGMLNLPIRAEQRVEGMVAERYLYNSIMHPNEYVVDGYAEGVMPAIYEDTYTEQEVLDLVAYLMTLGDYPEREPVFMEVPVEATASDDAETVEETTIEETETDSETAETNEDETEADTDEVETESGETPPEPVEEPVDMMELDLSGVPTNIEFLADNGSVIQGEALFNATLADDMACSACHSVDGTGEADVTSIHSDQLPAYLWAAIFSQELHGELGTQYTDEISGAQASHLVAYLISLQSTDTDE